MVFSLVAIGIPPASAATVSRLDSAPGQSQADWEATDAYKAFICPEGTLRGGGVDLNFTSDRSDDKYFVTCDEPSPTAADDADFSKRSRDAAAVAEVESQAYSAANPGKQKCVQWGPVVHRNGISTTSGGVCANIVGVVSTSDSSTVSSPSVSETSTAPTPTPAPTPTASSTSRIPYTQPCAGGTDRTPGLPQCLMPEGIGGSVWNLVDNNSGAVLNGAVCSEGVCGRNGEWRQWPADRKLNDRLWPTGYPEDGTYIQTPFDYGYWGRYFTNGVYEVNGGGILQPGSRTIIWPVQTPAPRVDTATVTSETSTSTSAPETSTPISTPSPTPTPTPTPAPSSEPRGLGGYAVIHPQGYVCGVIVGNAYFGNNDRTMTSEYMGCPVGSPIIFQTKPSPTGNVAGWHGANVTYASGIFTIRNNGLVAMTISDGIATDSTGRMWDTGSGATLRAATVVTPALPISGDTATVTSAPSSGSSNTGTTTDTRTVTMPLETTTAVIAVAIPAADEDLSTLDEIFPEEEIIDSIEAVVQSNGTTRIQVSTGYNLTALTVVATKKGSKKKYTYRITTNADGERKFKSGLNLRGYTVVLLKGSAELDRMYIS